MTSLAPPTHCDFSIRLLKHNAWVSLKMSWFKNPWTLLAYTWGPEFNGCHRVMALALRHKWWDYILMNINHRWPFNDHLSSGPDDLGKALFLKTSSARRPIIIRFYRTGHASLISLHVKQTIIFYCTKATSKGNKVIFIKCLLLPITS